MKRAIALGTFDGLHVAHMAVLKAAARQETPHHCVLLFDHHPLQDLQGHAPPRLLTDEERNQRLRELHLDILYAKFTELRDMPPEMFFAEVLLGRYNAGALCCGYDYHFGAKGAGDVALLETLCAKHRVQLQVLPEIKYKGEPVSSTRIRKALEAGSVEEANAMLGRPYGYSFPVVTGEQIGRTLGAPTINQMFPQGFAVPRYGVYASQALVEGGWRSSVTNIGTRPSFSGSRMRSETFITGYEGDLYGRRVPVRLLRFMRPEQKFDSIEQLRAQIAKDALHAQLIIDN